MRYARWLYSTFAARPAARKPRPARRLGIELLEDRTVPTVFTVTSTGDNGGIDPAPFAGTGTLRQAILDANAAPGADVITFALPDTLKGPTGWWTIQPLIALPLITGPVVIDGWSQAGAGLGLAPRVMLDGSSAGPADGLAIIHDSTVRGLAVGNFSPGAGFAGAGIALYDGGNTVQGCYAGIDPSGSTVAPNNVGVYDFATSPTLGIGNTIGGANAGEGNVLSGNGMNLYSTGYGATVRRNLIGLNAAGTTAVDPVNSINLRMGFAPDEGYLSVVADNVIGGSYAWGIWLDGVRHVRITGNLIGTDVTGMHPIPNGQAGIQVGLGAYDIVIGGTDPGSRNVIAASGWYGIVMGGAEAGAIRVQGNYIGTNAAGLVAPGFGNGGAIGIGQASSSGVIGGSEPGAGNLIAGNLAGINIRDVSGNVISGNVIRDNGSGIAVWQHDAGTGTATGNTISGNSIYNNGGLGIDLLYDENDSGGVTLNDSLGHAGANHFQNFPVLTSLNRAGDGITVAGTLTQAVTPNTTFRIEFFANRAADPSGYGEGERFLGSIDITTDANGVAAISKALPALLAGEGFVTATATNLATGDTSEFSHARAVPTVTVVGGSFVYDGQPHPATGSVTGVNGEDLGAPTLTYSYTDNDGNVVTLAGPPVEPGYYTVTATFAGNDTYFAASATATITIALPVNVLTDLSKAFKAGRVIPIKLQLLDAAGNNISDPTVAVLAIKLERVNADGSRELVSLQDAGGANPGNLFRYDAALGGYVFNLSTKGLTAGTYALTIAWTLNDVYTEQELGFNLI